MSKATWRARVYYEDTDSGGVVYYANYLRFAERARTEWLRMMGLSHAGLMADHGIIFVVRHVEVDYKAPARLDDLLRVDTEIVKCGGASLDMHQVIRLEEAGDPARGGERGAVLVEVKVTLVAITSDGKVYRLPDALRSEFERGVVK